MAIHIKTRTPKKLLSAYKKAIDDGHVKTWTYDGQGDFTHTTEQWTKKAWLRPKIKEKEELTLYILAPREADLSTAVYAVYHGRFVESMLRHCDSLFTDCTVSSNPEEGDVV